jgi:hypothetical protein
MAFKHLQALVRRTEKGEFAVVRAIVSRARPNGNSVRKDGWKGVINLYFLLK